LFRDLADAFAGRESVSPPTFGEVADVMVEHARMLVDWFGERQAILSFRKHGAWYTRGFRSSARLRDRLMRVTTLLELEEVLATIHRDQPFPEKGHLVRRGKRSGTQKVVLPKGFWDDPDDPSPPDADDMVSGG
jgi:hypothetical protein